MGWSLACAQCRDRKEERAITLRRTPHVDFRFGDGDTPTGAVRDDSVEEEDGPEDEASSGAFGGRGEVERGGFVREAEILDHPDCQALRSNDPETQGLSVSHTN